MLLLLPVKVNAGNFILRESHDLNCIVMVVSVLLQRIFTLIKIRELDSL